jgi:hypothetical protein
VFRLSVYTVTGICRQTTSRNYIYDFISLRINALTLQNHSFRPTDIYSWNVCQFPALYCRLRLKCDGTRAETRIRLSAKRTSPFKSAGGSQFSRLLAAEVCALAVVMLDTPCSEIVWRVLDTHSICQFPLHFPSRESPCAITFQLHSTDYVNWLG